MRFRLICTIGDTGVSLGDNRDSTQEDSPSPVTLFEVLQVVWTTTCQTRGITDTGHPQACKARNCTSAPLHQVDNPRQRTLMTCRTLHASLRQRLVLFSRRPAAKFLLPLTTVRFQVSISIDQYTCVWSPGSMQQYKLGASWKGCRHSFRP